MYIRRAYSDRQLTFKITIVRRELILYKDIQAVTPGILNVNV